MTVKFDDRGFQVKVRRIEGAFSGPGLVVTFGAVVDRTGGGAVKTSIKEKDLIWRHNMIRSVRSDVKSLSKHTVVFEIGPRTGYSEIVAKGLPHNANVALLRQWVREKMKPADVNRATFLLWRKIKTKGARPHPFRERAVEVAKLSIYRPVADTVRQTARALR